MKQMKTYFGKARVWLETPREFKNMDAMIIWILLLSSVIR